MFLYVLTDEYVFNSFIWYDAFVLQAKQAALKKEREEQKAAEKLLKDEAKKLEKETKADETKATQSAFQQFTESQNLSNDQLLATFQQKMGRRAAAMKKESDDEQSENENDWNED